MTKLRDGYFRQVDSKVGDDNYLLKAKGGYIGLHTGRNNEANKVVRTDEYGYIQAGWINTTSGSMDGSAPARIYASYDGYIRYMTPGYFFSNLSNSGTSISVTVGGQNRTLVVNYATYASFIKGPDNRSTDNAPSWYMSNRGSASVYSEFCMSGGAWSGRYENRVTFTPWSNQSGERPVQMAFNNSGAALRTSASDSNWNSWYYILTSGNYTSWINTTNFPGLNKTGTVTSVATGTGLTGGTITSTGTISINSTYQTYISHGENAYNSLSNYYPVLNPAGKWSASGNGVNAYCLIAEINTNGGYINYPITFEIGGRGTITSRVTIRFVNQQAVDPDCNLFATDEATCYYLYKAATSTWRLYASSPSDATWGTWYVYRVFGNNASRVTMKMETVSSLPSGYRNVTYTGNVAYATTSGNAASASSVAWANISGKPINFKAYSGSLSSAGWKTLQGNNSSPSIAIAYNNSAANWNSGTYSASLIWGCTDTRGLIDCAYNTPKVTFGGCYFGGATDDNPTWYFKIAGTAGTEYNLDTRWALAGHNHDSIYVNVTGDTMTGALIGTRIWLNHGSNLSSNYSWTNSALTVPNIEVQNYTGTVETQYPTITLHHYGYGGPRLSSKQGIMYIYGGNTDAKTLGSKNTYFKELRIYPYNDNIYVSDYKVWHAGNDTDFFKYRGELYQNNNYNADLLGIGSYIFRSSGYGNVGSGSEHINALNENSTIEVFGNLQLSTTAWSNTVSYRVKWGAETNASRPNRWSSWYNFLSSENYTSYVYSKSESDNRFVNVTGDTMSGTLIFNGVTASNWCEGIRINNASNGWTTLTMGGTATSGTGEKIWSLHTYDGSFYLAKNGSSSFSNGISHSSGQWLIKGTGSSYEVAKFTGPSTHAGISIFSASGYNPFIRIGEGSNYRSELGYSYSKGTLYLGAYNTDEGIINLHIVNSRVGIKTYSPETVLDVNGVQQIYIRGNNNTAFRDLLLLKQQNSSETSGQNWGSSYPSFGIGFRRYWTSGSSPYGETTCAGIYATVSSSWRGGLVFRTKNNETAGGTHDTTPLRLRPDGVAEFYKRIDSCNITSNASYMNSALQIREYNYGGAQSDTWGNAPRLSWHWSGRVQAQIALASNNHLYISENDFSNAYRIVMETGTWGISITGNATTASYPYGFTSRGTSDWSGVSGTFATDWSVNGADIMFKYDGSKLNVITDGRFYQGIDIYGASKRVLDEYDITHTKWGDANTLDGYDYSEFLRKVTVPDNAANDFNTFENMTLTGRGDPTTGASLSNAPWSGAGPAGGYGVLTYLWSGYGTQMAWGYASNRIYIRNKYYNSGAVWRTTWDSLALSADLNNYYTKSESNGIYLRKDTSDTSVGTIRSTYYGPGFANDVNAGSWAYTRFKSGTNEWHVGTNSSGGYIGSGGAFEIRSVGASYSGIAVRYNTSSYGKLVVSVPSGECSIGYYSNGAVRWTVGCSDGSNYGWYQGVGGGWKMTLNTSGYLTATGFCKSGSSDSYVLLGGGSHKALSDFSMTHSHPYLPLSGGTMNSGAQILVSTTSKGSSDVYNGGIQLREATFSTTSCTDNMYDAPGITFHWGGWWVHKLNMHSNALYWDNSIIITSSNISSYAPSSSVTVSNSNPGLGKSSATIATIGGTAITAYVNDSDKVDGLHFWTGSSLPSSPSSDTIYIIV